MKRLFILFIVIIITFSIIKFNEKDEIIRLHVKANSDSIEDQELKLKVRDKVLELINLELAKAHNVNQARSILQSLIPTIKSEATKIIINNGYTYSANVSLSKREFPTRYYDGIKYNQGIYEALMVEIGNADGKNWWCVAYPRLCYVALDSKTTSYTKNRKSYKKSILKVIRSWFR